jgi:hypothetical protein
LLLVLILLHLPGYASDEELNLEICNDSLYQVLKKKNINELEEREYKYYMQYDKDCNSMKALKYEKEKRASGQALKAVSSILGILLGVAGLVLFVVLIQNPPS